MTGWTDDEYQVECPMPDCTEPLLVQWHAAFEIAPDQLTDDSAIEMDGATTSTWQVECCGGHVILLPGDTGCGCDDPEGDACKALGHDSDDYDWGEDYRVMRRRDMDRLQALIARLKTDGVDWA